MVFNLGFSFLAGLTNLRQIEMLPFSFLTADIILWIFQYSQFNSGDDFELAVFSAADVAHPPKQNVAINK